MKASLRRNCVIVKKPSKAVLDELQRFDRASGTYMPLYSRSQDGEVIATLPGFAARIAKHTAVADDRMPLPEPDLDVLGGVDGILADRLGEMLRDGSGVLTMADVFSFEKALLAMVRAYPRELMLQRGTPLSVVAVAGRPEAVDMRRFLAEALPDREVGLLAGESCDDSDDILVVEHSKIREVCGPSVGLLASTMPSVPLDLANMAGAARFAVLPSPYGGRTLYTDVMEGLFGALRAVTYDDAARAGVAAKVVVCYLNAPEPVQSGYGTFEIERSH